MNQPVVLTLIGVIVVVTVNIVLASRWSGRIDGYMLANDQRFTLFMQAIDKQFKEVGDDIRKQEDEIKRLRDARHAQDGHIQRHEGMLRELDRRQTSRRSSDYLPGSGDTGD